MSRSLGPALPPALLARFTGADLPAWLGRALPFVTLGPDGTLHPMLCSYLEWLALDARTLRVAIGAGSRSAWNLAERRVGTLLLVEPEQTVYVKCRAIGAPLGVGGLARFEMAVEDVLEDAPAEAEGGVRIVSGITYAPVPALDGPWARQIRAVLHARG